MSQANGIWNQAKVGVHISDKADFKSKMVKGERNSTHTREVNNISILQTIVNMGALTAPQLPKA